MTFYIADSAVFIMGNCNVDSSLLITIPSVVDEIRAEAARLRLDLAREGGLRVEWPEPEMLKKVKELAAYTRDLEELSKTDLEILAKALEYKDRALLLTDDYAVQNVAVQLGIEVKPIAQKKIKDLLIWEKKCIGCKKTFDSGEICPICGSPLKKKRKRKIQRKSKKRS
ncbi:MAG: NOB1 family endonuclease [Methanosarcinaceae archaeon]|nr:NOB1 family endonuclease [Methanosarcinaceae archaeon]MDD4332065.1 NOB1 family endonuclease [Methanosarcinaceae archaeon]